MSLHRIVFWQPFASPHQEAFLEAVAEQFAGEVILGVERADLPPARVAQGWRRPQHVRVRVVDISQPANHAALAAHRDSDSLHVFTGFFSHPLVWSGFHELASSRARLAIYSEAPEQPLLTGWIKRARGRMLAARWARRIAFVLAVGGVGCEFFARIGFPADRIVPFGYYLPAPPLSGNDPQPCGDTFTFISAGQLVRRKGVDLLIDACSRLPPSGWGLHIFGDGVDRRHLERLVRRRGLENLVTFHGAARNSVVQDALSVSDCAVLPSRFDGWGALVSEALGAGTPCICTSACGAASAAREVAGRDSQVCAPSVRGLAAALAAALSGGKVSAARRLLIRDTAADLLSPARAAGRFLSLAG